MRINVNTRLRLIPADGWDKFNSTSMSTWRLIGGLGGFLAAMLISPAVWAASSASLSQCGNLASGLPTNCAWQNGNLNANQAHWQEGDSVPYQLILSGLTPNSSYMLRSVLRQPRAENTP